MKTFFACLIVLLFVTACGGGDSSSDQKISTQNTYLEQAFYENIDSEKCVEYDPPGNQGRYEYYLEQGRSVGNCNASEAIGICSKTLSKVFYFQGDKNYTFLKEIQDHCSNAEGFFSLNTTFPPVPVDLNNTDYQYYQIAYDSSLKKAMAFGPNLSELYQIFPTETSVLQLIDIISHHPDIKQRIAVFATKSGDEYSLNRFNLATGEVSIISNAVWDEYSCFSHSYSNFPSKSMYISAWSRESLDNDCLSSVDSNKKTFFVGPMLEEDEPPIETVHAYKARVTHPDLIETAEGELLGMIGTRSSEDLYDSYERDVFYPLDSLEGDTRLYFYNYYAADKDTIYLSKHGRLYKTSYNNLLHGLPESEITGGFVDTTIPHTYFVAIEHYDQRSFIIAEGRGSRTVYELTPNGMQYLFSPSFSSNYPIYSTKEHYVLTNNSTDMRDDRYKFEFYRKTDGSLDESLTTYLATSADFYILNFDNTIIVNTGSRYHFLTSSGLQNKSTEFIDDEKLLFTTNSSERPSASASGSFYTISNNNEEIWLNKLITDSESYMSSPIGLLNPNIYRNLTSRLASKYIAVSYQNDFFIDLGSYPALLGNDYSTTITELDPYLIDSLME